MSLIIRKEQFDIFSRISLNKFRDRAVEHVSRCWPREYQAVGLEEVINDIDKSIEEALQRGLRSDRDIILHIDLSFLLKSKNCQITDIEWINKIFAEPYLDLSTKIKIVWNRAKEKFSIR